MRTRTLRLQQKRQDLSHEGVQLMLNQIRRERIQRYQVLQNQIKSAFTAGLCELLSEDVPTNLSTTVSRP